MAKTLACRDMGVDCNWVGTAETIEELVKGASDHPAQAHGVKEIPREMVGSMERAIKDV